MKLPEIIKEYTLKHNGFVPEEFIESYERIIVKNHLSYLKDKKRELGVKKEEIIADPDIQEYQEEVDDMVVKDFYAGKITTLQDQITTIDKEIKESQSFLKENE